MAFLASAWLGCSSSNGATGQQTCKGNPGDEFCSCPGSGSCNDGLTCATDLLVCVHIAGTPTPATGGTTGTGTGGTVTTTGTGGTVATGATGGVGGRITGTGGIASTGGTTGGGGTRATGGTAGTTAGVGGRGGSNSGGSAGSGTGSGGSAGMSGGSGGATATSCGTLTPSANGNGQFTYYWFGQGTYMTGGHYQTACGYTGTENGQTDTVANLANSGNAKNTYFAAIPGTSSSNFNSSGACGSCIQVTNAGHTIIATIIDECPEDSNPTCKNNPTGELDLSKSAFDALGYSTGNPSGTSWKVVPCPVTGNVIVRIKSGNQNEAYIENLVLALKSVSGPGGNANRQSYGAWHFNSNLGSGSQLTLTDAADRTLMVTLTSGSADQNQDTGKQFPACQ